MNDKKVWGVTDAPLNAVAVNEEKVWARKRIGGNHLNLKEKQPDVDRKREQVDDEMAPELKTHHIVLCQQILDYYGFLGLFFGIICRYDWNRYSHCLFWVTNFLIFLADFCIVYTVYTYCQRGDIVKILEPLAVSGLAITCTLKWGVFLKYTNNLLALMFSMRKICEQTKTGNRVDAITASFKKTYSLLRAFAVALIAVMVFFVSVPLKFFFVNHIYYTLLPFLIPFCETDTLKGYLWATFFQSLLGVYSGIATLMFGTAFLIVICSYGVLVNLMELDFKDLNDMWSPSSDTPIAVRHAFLNNIAAKLQDMQSYIKEVKKIYETKFFIFFLVSYIGQVMSLYQITEKDWIPGYTSLFIVFIEMMFYCMVGTQTISLGEKMCDFIQQTDWYSFDVHSQKTLRFILEQCQRPCKISLKFLGTLNMVTGIGVIKGIYYYYTVMTEVL